MMTNERHVSPMDFDLVDLGQASLEDVARIEAHGARCPDCATRRAEHARRVLHFRTAVFSRTAEKLAARPRLPPRWRWSLGLALPLAAGVLLLARGHPVGLRLGGHLPSPETIGIKGTPMLQVFARRRALGTAAAEVTKVKDGDRLAAGDALRFVLSPTGLPYVLIASVDGAAQTSVYYPFQGEASAEVDSKGPVPVPGSIVLDQAPGPERIFVIHSERPISASTARAALARLGAGGADAIRAAQHLPIEGTVQSTLCFEKENGR
jgi:hypothetical protein